MAMFETWVNRDLMKIMTEEDIRGTVFTLDNQGNKIGVRVFSNGQPVTLSGTVNGYCILADGTTVPVSGSRSGNQAWIILPQSAYAVPGMIRIAIKLTDGSTITTLAGLVGSVALSRTANMITPSSQVITDWSQQIAAEMQAVEDASAAQDVKIEDLKSAVSIFQITNQTPNLSVQKNHRVDPTTGAVASDSGRNAVENIAVEGDAVLVKLGECTVGGFRGIAFYDQNGTFISGAGVRYTVGQLVYLVKLPTNAKTMSITTYGSGNVFGVRFIYYQPTDKELTQSDVPADGKITGDMISLVQSRADESFLLSSSAIGTTESNYHDLSDRGVATDNVGFILSSDDDKCSIDIIPEFSSTTGSYTAVNSGSFLVRFYSIERSEDAISITGQIGIDTSYNIGDTVKIPYFDSSMLFAIREPKDGQGNAVKVGWKINNKTWANRLAYFDDNEQAQASSTYGIGGSVIIKRAEKIDNPNALSGKKITIIGDSITQHNYRAKTNWAMLIEQWKGISVQNLAVSGSGFVKTDTNYITRIQYIQASPDIIGVAMSWNDLSVSLPIGNPDDTGTNSIAGYVNDFFTALIAQFPATPIIAYCQGPWYVYKPGVTESDNYISVMKELLAKKGIPFDCRLYYGSVLRPWNNANVQVYYKVDDETSQHYGETDGIHPNSEGHKVIARYLVNDFEENVVSDIG